MIAAWYGIVSFMLIIYVVLDGRNFGAGMLHWLVARTPEERRQVVAAIGPLWSWHEVWLVGFGGTTLAAFPKLLASGFAGYYLALFLILWCLILRGMALEVGGHINDRMWQGFWDFVFVVGSTLLAVLFGAAAGNMARGVPLDADGTFSMAFFNRFPAQRSCGTARLVYGVGCTLRGQSALAAHGATYLALKTEGPVHDRSAGYAKVLWVAAVPLLLVISAESAVVRPDLLGHAMQNPAWWFGLLLVCGAAFLLISGLRTGREMRAFIGSNLLLAGWRLPERPPFFRSSCIRRWRRKTRSPFMMSPPVRIRCSTLRSGGRSASRWPPPTLSSCRANTPARSASNETTRVFY